MSTSSDDCNATTKNPADQPKGPGPDCKPTTYGPGPNLDPPASKCKPPDECNCPPPPTTSESCFEKLIDQQAQDIAKADKAKEFKTELEAFLSKAKAAAQDYSREKYDKLVADWKKEDDDIADLIRRLVCAVPCWKCVIECYVCPLLNRMHDAEGWLYGDGTLPAVDNNANLLDKRHWYDRAVDKYKREFDRVKAGVGAWEKPALAIDKVLSDNRKIISDVTGKLNSSAVFDVFLKLVPMHLAIAPPQSVAKTRIDVAYTFEEFCECDASTGDPWNCCGPDVGPQSMRERFIGPQPYLIDPNSYFDLVCCLVTNYYLPAKDALAGAQATLQNVDDLIKRSKAQIDDGIKSFEKNARGAIPANVNCCGEAVRKKDEGSSSGAPASAK